MSNQENNTQVATHNTIEALTIGTLLVSEREEAKKFQNVIASILPEGMDTEAYLLMCYKAIKQGCVSPDGYKEAPLLKASGDSVKNAVMDAARHGLTLTGFNNQADLIVRKGICRTEINAKGMKDLAFRTGLIDVIDVFPFYEGDIVKNIRGSKPHFSVEHAYKPNASQTGTAGILSLKSGSFIVEIMTLAEMQAFQAKMLSGLSEKARGFSTWFIHYQRMIEKTIMKRLCSKIPFLGAQTVTWGSVLAMARIEEPIETEATHVPQSAPAGDAMSRIRAHLQTDAVPDEAVADLRIDAAIESAENDKPYVPVQPTTPHYEPGSDLEEDVLE